MKKSIGKPKLKNQIFGGIIFLLMGISFSLLILLITLLPPRYIVNFFGKKLIFSSYVSEIPFVLVYVAIFLIILIESTKLLIEHNFKTEKSKLEYREKNILSYFILFYQNTNMTYRIFLVFILSTFLGLFSYFFINLIIYNKLSFSIQFFVLISIYMLYIIVRNQLKFALNKVSAIISKKIHAKKTKRKISRLYETPITIVSVIFAVGTVIALALQPLAGTPTPNNYWFVVFMGMTFISWILCFIYSPSSEINYFEEINFEKPDENIILKAIDGILNSEKVEPFYVHAAPRS